MWFPYVSFLLLRLVAVITLVMVTEPHKSMITTRPSTGYSLMEIRAHTVGSQLSVVLVEVLERYFVRNHSVTMIERLAVEGRLTYELQSDIVDQVMQGTADSIAYIFRSPAALNRVRRPARFNLFFLDGFAAFERVFSALDPAQHDYFGYYLLVLTQLDDHLLPATLQRLFARLWRLNIVNVNVIAMVRDGDRSRLQHVLLYTYYPYRADGCERIIPQLLHRYEQTDVDGSGSSSPALELFPDKLANLYGCPLTVATFQLPPFVMLQGNTSDATATPTLIGLEGDLVRALGRKLNFSLRVLTPHDGYLWGRIGRKNDPDTATGCIWLVRTERANLTFGRFAIRGDRNAVMRHGLSYYAIRMMVAVSPGRAYTPFEKLFLPFAPRTWVAALFMLAGATVFIAGLEWCRVSRAWLAFLYGRRVRAPLLNLLNVYFGGPVPRDPGQTFARTILMHWILYSFVMRSVYQGLLYDYLQARRNYSHPRTLAALLNRDFRFLSMNGTASYLQPLRGILERTHWLPDDDVYVQRALDVLAGYRDRTALIVDSDRVAYYNRNHYRTGHVHLVGTVLVRLPIGLYYPRKSCLTDTFDRLIDQMVMSGYFTHHLRRYVSYSSLYRQIQAASHPLLAPLTNDQLFGCYELLGGFLLLASAVLLAEMAAPTVRPVRERS
ncbi:hypothetical protein AND_004303 [Anopheles darlingi]|uniref:Putative ionotropic receptor ligand binding domain-containing protein n=1 Tax=Anopheles darlingi TaxID=43151 RepID=W5JIM8_ANODA|nr:hypothetical protein AND_004303 [Anopheles darlingi]